MQSDPVTFQNGALHPRPGFRGDSQKADPQTQRAQPQVCGPCGVRAHRARHEVCREGNRGHTCWEDGTKGEGVPLRDAPIEQTPSRQLIGHDR